MNVENLILIQSIKKIENHTKNTINMMKLYVLEKEKDALKRSDSHEYFVVVVLVTAEKKSFKNIFINVIILNCLTYNL